MKKLWICGQNKKGEWPDLVWEIQGVFDSEEKAIKACRDKNYFIMPLNLNESLPHHSVDISGGYYPLEKVESGL